MDSMKIIEKAIKENPELALILEVSARAQQAADLEPVKELRTTTDVAANPTTNQGVISLGCVLGDEGNLVP